MHAKSFSAKIFSGLPGIFLFSSLLAFLTNCGLSSSEKKDKISQRTLSANVLKNPDNSSDAAGKNQPAEDAANQKFSQVKPAQSELPQGGDADKDKDKEHENTSSEIFFKINQGSLFTNSLHVTLTVAAPDLGLENIAKMFIGNTAASCAEPQWSDFVSEKAWDLDPSQSNTKASVYAKFLLVDAQESECVSASIIHDDKKPEAPADLAVGFDAFNNKVQLKWSPVPVPVAEQDSSSPLSYAVAFGTEAGRDDILAWTSVGAQTDLAQSPGELAVRGRPYYASVRSIDAAGNASESRSQRYFAYNEVSDLVAGGDASSTSTHACAVLSSGQLKCWGDNRYGQLGQDDTRSRGAGAADMGAALQPLTLGEGRKVVQVVVGGGIFSDSTGDADAFTCVLLDNGLVKCWGGNQFGQLGYGDTVPRGGSVGSMASLAPVALGTLAGDGTGEPVKATFLTAGNGHVCAVLENGRLKCWGRNHFGQLGQENTKTLGDESGEMGDQLPYLNLGLGEERVLEVAAQRQSTCMLASSGMVKCWGFNSHGQLGLDSTVHKGNDPGEMGAALAAVKLDSTVTRLYASSMSWFNCAVFSSAEVKCWGRDGAGQLGQGLGTSLRVGDGSYKMADLKALDLGTGLLATSLGLGGTTVCALLNNADHSYFGMKCWGGNSYGELGLEDKLARGAEPGQLGDKLPAVNLGSGRTVLKVVGAASYHCALLDDKTVKCFGRNDRGQLGLGDRVSRGGAPGQMGDALPRLEL